MKKRWAYIGTILLFIVLVGVVMYRHRNDNENLMGENTTASNNNQQLSQENLDDEQQYNQAISDMLKYDYNQVKENGNIYKQKDYAIYGGFGVKVNKVILFDDITMIHNIIPSYDYNCLRQSWYDEETDEKHREEMAELLSSRNLYMYVCYDITNESNRMLGDDCYVKRDIVLANEDILNGNSVENFYLSGTDFPVTDQHCFFAVLPIGDSRRIEIVDSVCYYWKNIEADGYVEEMPILTYEQALSSDFYLRLDGVYTSGEVVSSLQEDQHHAYIKLEPEVRTLNE